MKIEVILNGKGSITIEDETVRELRDIKATYRDCLARLVEVSNTRRPIGFQAGTDLETEIAVED